MPDPTAQTLLGIPGVAILWALTAVVVRPVRLAGVPDPGGPWRAGRPEPRWDQLPTRLWNVVVNVAGQRRMFDNPGIGLAHLVIFWAFIFYAGSFAWNLLRGLFPFLPIPYPDEVVLVAVPMVVLSVADPRGPRRGGAPPLRGPARRAWPSRGTPP